MGAATEYRYNRLTWAELDEAIGMRKVVILPTGSTEQHGYLSLLTDIKIPLALADAASQTTGVLVAPPLNFGIAPYFLAFPGTLSLRAATLCAAVEDIAQGAQALSEIDFVALCRRYRLPRPHQQTLRADASGRRRYLDATWRRADGRVVVVEVDGALHLAVSRWWADQLRQNELALAGAVVLRFPSVVVRDEPGFVAGQLPATGPHRGRR